MLETIIDQDTSRNMNFVLHRSPATFDTLRAKLSDLSHAGKQAEVKKLINSFAPKLTDIKSGDIEAAMRAANKL